MIRLCVKSYCEECPKFKPILEEKEDTLPNGYSTIIKQIKCENHEICDELYTYLAKTVKNRGRKI